MTSANQRVGACH